MALDWLRRERRRERSFRNSEAAEGPSINVSSHDVVDDSDLAPDLSEPAQIDRAEEFEGIPKTSLWRSDLDNNPHWVELKLDPLDPQRRDAKDVRTDLETKFTSCAHGDVWPPDTDEPYWNEALPKLGLTLEKVSSFLWDEMGAGNSRESFLNVAEPAVGLVRAQRLLEGFLGPALRWRGIGYGRKFSTALSQKYSAGDSDFFQKKFTAS